MTNADVPAGSSEGGDHINEIVLRGVLAAEPAVKVLPSGDELSVFRLTVRRPPTPDRVKVDSIDCVTSVTRVRRSLERAAAGDVVDVSGRLQRRFWRAPSGQPSSRYEVVVKSIRVTRRRSAASPAQTQASA